MHASLWFSIFTLYIFMIHPRLSIPVDVSIWSNKINLIEVTSHFPKFDEKVSTLPTNSFLNSSKQLRNDITTTEKYETIKKMNLIKPNEAKTTPATNTDEIIVQVYRINNTNDGTTCILMTVDALISFIYTSKFNELEESDTFVPSASDNKVYLRGDCASKVKSSMSLKWSSFQLNFDFAKTPGGERWFVNRIQLNFNTKEKTFKNPVYHEVDVRAETMDGEIFYPTPVGRSFKCHRELEVNLIDSAYPDLKVKLLLRELTLEPFIFKNNEFDPEYACAAAGVGSFRSETAPFIFGSVMSVAALVTIMGYAVYRHMRTNKVQYGAME